jgi:hypothetical protein
MSKYVGFGCRIQGVWSLFYAASTGSLNRSAAHVLSLAYHQPPEKCTPLENGCISSSIISLTHRANQDPKSRCLPRGELLLLSSAMAHPAWLCLDGYLRCISCLQSPPTLYAATVDSIFKRSLLALFPLSFILPLLLFLAHIHTHTHIHARTHIQAKALLSFVDISLRHDSLKDSQRQPSPSTSSDRLSRTWLQQSNLHRKTQSKPFRMFSNDVSIPIE